LSEIYIFTVYSFYSYMFSSLFRFRDDMSELPRVKHTQLFINNKFVDSVSGKTFDTINPSVESVIAKIAEADRSNITPVFFLKEYRNTLLK
jgi:hypothetical protein